MTNERVPKAITDALEAGLQASMMARNSSCSSINVSLTAIQQRNAQEELRKLTNEGNGQRHIVVVFGPMGDAYTIGIRAVLKELNVVAFSPFTGSSAVRGWEPHLYFLRTEPAAELASLIRYALAQLRVRRLGFMYLRGVSFGDKEHELAVKWMSWMGHELCGVFSVETTLDKASENGVFDAAYEQFVGTRPQAVLLFGSPIHDTKKFVKRLLMDGRTAGVSLLVPECNQAILLSSIKEVVKGGGRFTSGQAILAGTTPSVSDTQYKAIERYHMEMASYIANKKLKIGDVDAKALYMKDAYGTHMAHGWVVGEVLARALSSKEWLRNRTAFRESLFNQRRYVIDDLVFGDFGGNCSKNAAPLGAMCRCNQGGNVVFMKRVMSDLNMEELRGGRMVVGVSNCYMNNLRLHSPLNGLFILMNDHPVATRANEAMLAGAVTLNGDGSLGHGDRLFMHVLSTTLSEAAYALQRDMGTRITAAVFGVVAESIFDVREVTLIDPIPLVPRLNSYRRDVIHLSPTVEQQFYVLAEYLMTGDHEKPCAVVRSDDAAGFVEVLDRTMAAHGGSLGHVRQLVATSSLAGHLPVDGSVFVVGLVAGDAATLASHLREHRDVRLLVLFSEVALLYDELVTAFRNCTGASRLLFATNLPHWADRDSGSPTVKRYHAAVSDHRQWSPLSLLGFATARLMQEVLQRQDRTDANALADYFYTNIAVSVDDMNYGPFDDSKCVTARSLVHNECAVNYGATRISVWSMARALDPTVPEVHQPVTRALVYREPLYLGMPLHTFVGVFFAFILVMAFVGVLIYAQFFRRDARDNRNAPKALSAPVTLVFTDIESSTGQWAANPQLMPDAIATHHRLIRSLIARHRCYEVKTIGDSFMIACKSALAAVELVRDLQRQFLEHDWGTAAFDESYRAFEEKRAAEDAEYVPPTARLEPEVYRRLWNGLRVRAGVHTGLCDIRHDEVTKGYDYYGRTSNMAARTESVAHGGQVLLTRAAYMALRTDERKQLDVTPLGAVPLRGVPVPVEMFQVNGVPGRTFGPLRLDVEVNVDDADCTSSSLSGSVPSLTEMSRGGRMVALSLYSLLSTFPAAEQRKVLLSFCERWRVPAPSKRRQNWDDDVYQEVILRIASAVAKVMESRAVNEESDCNFNSSKTSSYFLSSKTDKVSWGSLSLYRPGDGNQRLVLSRKSTTSNGSRRQVQVTSLVGSTSEANSVPHSFRVFHAE
ncbi:receptor-type adenylate cyclase GRESAG 4, putative [Trypanosoma vivax Y486]|uniref:adenylate cyclase n=1 Tax=Trypanosoma vivax (strain Y486) TaxID=1055687 RepID=F9WN77_TRYVY|nr:receptor-type adenylate cyclase GRESAG 4, putative [Trypanosoma vivax Y486]|eukprot:CCD18993.1 receptor-type adenylate cyclase GRESAG 4, putative [Trypanosoma vivax Y486]